MSESSGALTVTELARAYQQHQVVMPSGAIAFDLAAEQECETARIALFDLGRDLSKWAIAVPSVETRKEPLTGLRFYCLLISH